MRLLAVFFMILMFPWMVLTVYMMSTRESVSFMKRIYKIKIWMKKKGDEMSKFITFVAEVFGSVVIINKKNGHPLGKIEYYKPWKQHVFSASSDAVFNNSCLEDITKKLNELNKSLKEGIEVAKK